MNPASAYTANMAAAMESLAAVGYFFVWLIASVIVIALVELCSRAYALRTNRRARRTSPPAGAHRRSTSSGLPAGQGGAAPHADMILAGSLNRYHFTDPDDYGDLRPRPPAKPLLSGAPERGRDDAQR